MRTIKVILLSLIALSAAENAVADEAESWYRKGQEKLVANDFEGAIRNYTKAIEADHSLFKAYAGRGYIRAQMKNHDGAIEDYSMMIKLNPKVHQSYNLRGNALANIGRFHRAI